MRDLISTLKKKKKAQAGNESSSLPPKSSQARKKPPPSPPPPGKTKIVCTQTRPLPGDGLWDVALFPLLSNRSWHSAAVGFRNAAAISVRPAEIVNGITQVVCLFVCLCSSAKTLSFTQCWVRRRLVSWRFEPGQHPGMTSGLR